jgi:hypothetical protein
MIGITSAVVHHSQSSCVKRARVHKFSTTMEAVSKFYMPEEGHDSSSILKTHKN